MDARRPHHPWRYRATLAIALLATTACAGDAAPTAETEEAGRVAASFEVRAVIGQADSADAEPTADGGVVLVNRDHPGEFLDLGPQVLGADDVHHARAVEQEAWGIHVDLTDEGSERFAEVTAAAACADGHANRVAIVVDDTVISSPNVTVGCGSEIRERNPDPRILHRAGRRRVGRSAHRRLSALPAACQPCPTCGHA